MKRGIPVLTAVLAFSFLLSVVAIAAPQASAAGSAQITIHKADCPTTSATINIFTACYHNVVQGVEFTIGGASATTGTTGFASATVAPGTVTITEPAFTSLATAGSAFVYCSLQPTGAPVIFNQTITGGAIALTVGAGTGVVCDWYDRTTAPSVATVTVTIHRADCPITATGNIFTACHANRVAGVAFAIEGVSVETSSKGVASAGVTRAADGTVTITEPGFAMLATDGRAFVFCSMQPGGSPVLFAKNTTSGTISFGVPSASRVTCDWYDRTV